jgi:hypothetical protein
MHLFITTWVGIATTLRTGRSEDRTTVGARFFTVVQTGPVAYLASCTMDTGSFPVVKRPRRGFDHPPSSSAEVKERVELYLYSPSGLSWPVLGRTLPLPLFITTVTVSSRSAHVPLYLNPFVHTNGQGMLTVSSRFALFKCICS